MGESSDSYESGPDIDSDTEANLYARIHYQFEGNQDGGAGLPAAREHYYETAPVTWENSKNIAMGSKLLPESSSTGFRVIQNNTRTLTAFYEATHDLTKKRKLDSAMGFFVDKSSSNSHLIKNTKNSQPRLQNSTKNSAKRRKIVIEKNNLIHHNNNINRGQNITSKYDYSLERKNNFVSVSYENRSTNLLNVNNENISKSKSPIKSNGPGLANQIIVLSSDNEEDDCVILSSAPRSGRISSSSSSSSSDDDDCVILESNLRQKQDLYIHINESSSSEKSVVHAPTTPACDDAVSNVKVNSINKPNSSINLQTRTTRKADDKIVIQNSTPTSSSSNNSSKIKNKNNNHQSTTKITEPIHIDGYKKLTESSSSSINDKRQLSYREAMQKFYDSDCDSEIMTNTASQSKDSNWNINDDDKYLQFNKLSRYFKTNIQCYNCRQRGHMSKVCPEPQVQNVCYLCGLMGHRAKNCTMIPCKVCRQEGHYFSECPNLSKQWKKRCERCLMTGHLEMECPDIWRCYYLTTKSDTIVEGQSYGNLNFNKATCCNCGKKGHFYFECKIKRMDAYTNISVPYVISYRSGTHSSVRENLISPGSSKKKNKKQGKNNKQDVADHKGKKRLPPKGNASSRKNENQNSSFRKEKLQPPNKKERLTY